MNTGLVPAGGGMQGWKGTKVRDAGGGRGSQAGWEEKQIGLNVV